MVTPGVDAVLGPRWKRLPEIVGSPASNQGSKATVYKGLDTETGTPVAISVVRPEFAPSHFVRDMFLYGVERVRRLDHPALQKVLDVQCSDEGGVILVTQYHEGNSLNRLVREGAVFSEKEVVAIGLAMCDALEHSHQRDVVFSNLKPSNIVQKTDGAIVITGLPKPPVERLTMTELGAYAGNVFYLAPEVVRGEPVDARSDIYGVGIVLFELLTGSLPFYASANLAVTLASIASDPIPSLHGINAGISEALDHVVQRAMDKDVAKRFQTVSELRKALRSLQPGTRHLVTPARLAGIIAQSYPFPIADTYSSMQQQFDAPVRLGRLIDTFECILKLCAAIVLKDLLRLNLRPTHAEWAHLVAGLERPSLGHWLGLIRDCLRQFLHCRERVTVFEMPEMLYSHRNETMQNIGQQVDILLQLRNQIGHGSTPDLNATRHLLNEYLPVLQGIMTEQLFFCRYQLFVVERLDYSHDMFTLLLRAFVGQRPGGQLSSVQLPGPLATRELHIGTPTLSRSVSLHPFLIFETCDVCLGSELFYYNELHDNAVEYLSYQTGHLKRVPDLVSDMREVLGALTSGENQVG